MNEQDVDEVIFFLPVT